MLSRAGSDHFFSGLGRAIFFSGPFLIGLAISGCGPVQDANFWPIFGRFLTNSSAQRTIFEVQAGSGYPKSSPGRATRTQGSQAKFQVGSRPETALVFSADVPRYVGIVGCVSHLIGTPIDKQYNGKLQEDHLSIFH